MRKPRDSSQPRCEGCPLQGEMPVRAVGDVNAPIMIVGEAPGAEEVRRGRPFIGPSGRKLGALLKEANIPSKQLYVTNTVLCQLGKSKSGLEEASRRCRGRLLAEIDLLQPKVIVPLGNPATKAIINQEGITALRGQVFTVEFGGKPYKVVPTIHPAALLRHWAADSLVVEDLKRARAIALGEYEEVLDEDCDYAVLKEREALGPFFEEFAKQPTIVFDLETTGLDWRSDRILCASFSFKPHHARVIPLYTKEGPFWKGRDGKYVWMMLRKAMAESKVKKIGQNLNFDVGFMEQAGCPVANVWADTIHMHHLIDENLPHDLDFLTTTYAPEMGRYWKAIDDLNLPKKDGYLGVPTSILWLYAMKDADATMRVYSKLRDQLQQEKLWELCRTLTIPLANVLRKARTYGMYVDLTRLDAIADRCEEEIEAAKVSFGKQVGHTINLNSSQQLGKVLFDELGLPPSYTAPSKTFPQGQYSTSDDVLQDLRGNHVCVETVIRYRKLAKLSSTYLRGGKQGGLKRHVGEDSRVNPEFLVQGTTTGRLSCRSPNLQNIPAREGAEEQFSGSVIRSMFVAPPGGKLVAADYEKAELWSAAYCSDDKQLFEDLRTTDIHTAVATNMYGVEYEDVTSDQRWRAKTLNFGIPYGREEFSVAKELGVSVEEARGFIDAFFERYAGYARFRKRLLKQAKTTFLITNLFGRKRRVYGFKTIEDRKSLSHLEKQVLAFPAQSVVADRINFALVDIDRTLRARRIDATIVAQVHDEVIVEVTRAEDAPLVAEIVTFEMEKPIQGIAIPTEAKIIDSWNEKEGSFVTIDEMKRIHVGKVPR